MVYNPDPLIILKALKKWHVIVFCDQSGETLRAPPTQVDESDVDTLCKKKLFPEMRNLSA